MSEEITFSKEDVEYLENAIKRLEQENKELKEKVQKLDAMTGIFSARLMEKYKKALEEIREYCYKRSLDYDYTACCVVSKINEVLK